MEGQCPREEVKTRKKADIGLVGLAVMGENLAMNMESKGFAVAVYNGIEYGDMQLICEAYQLMKDYLHMS